MKLNNQNNENDFSKFTPTLSNTISRYSDEYIPESPETSPDEDYGSKKRIEDISYENVFFF